MRAAWYERQGPAHEVLTVGDLEPPEPGPDEVRIRLAASGINPGDVKKRQNAFGYGMPFPRIIPHSDGAGHVDQVGDGVANEWLGRRVWCYGAQTYRAFGTAAEFVTLPVGQVSVLPDHVSMERGACLGIPGLTAHRAVFIAGSVTDRTVLVQGGAGAVGTVAVQLARRGGALVLATVKRETDVDVAYRAGAHHVVQLGDGMLDAVRRLAPAGVDHVIDVAFDANVGADLEMLNVGGSIATYASGSACPAIPFWPLVFKNVRLHFLGSDDFPPQAKREAAQAVHDALVAGWPGPGVAARFRLEAIADAHLWVEQPSRRGRAVLVL
jgi:NADPH:quinone reductase